MTIEQNHTEVILDQAAGSLVGLAIGDALGSPAEGMTAAEIAGRHGFLMEMVGGGTLGLDPGETTSITTQAMVVAESLLRNRVMEPADIADRLSVWSVMRPKGIGSHAEAVLDRITSGEDWEIASLTVQAQNVQSADNGSLVRCAPLSLWHHGSPAVIIEESRLCSRITHPHALCQWSCAFLNLVTSGLLSGLPAPRAVDDALGICGHRGDVSFQVLDRARSAATDSDTVGLDPSVDVLDTLECAVWALVHHDSFEEAVSTAINLGGDPGTIGAATGAMAGAAYGFGSIPERWLVHVNDWQALKDTAVKLVSLS
jgi:ADP-ribosyl-[dinitrogen reductase] hydrolase